MRRVGRGGRSEEGAAIVDFVLVGTLLTVVFMGIVQLGVVLHVRNTLVDCASEGARYGAFADRSPADAAQRTRELISASLSSRYARDVTASRVEVSGLSAVRVSVSAPLPLVGLVGPSRTLTVSGHGAVEGQ